MNLNKAIDLIVERLKTYVGDKRAVVGLSGGIDSSVVAYFLAKALDKDNIFSVVLPYGDQDSSDGKLIASQLGISCTEVNIKPIIDKFPCQSDKFTKGNIMARIRMVVLYSYSNVVSNGGFVVGTTNKTEAEIGYYTKYGDGGVDIEPIADLYKTEVWQVGKILGVPQKIIDNKPTAGLWKGQQDEDDFGMTYQELDDILKTINNHEDSSGVPIEILLKIQYDEKNVEKVLSLIEGSEHKRHMPPVFIIK